MSKDDDSGSFSKVTYDRVAPLVNLVPGKELSDVDRD